MRAARFSTSILASSAIIWLVSLLPFGLELSQTGNSFWAATLAFLFLGFLFEIFDIFVIILWNIVVRFPIRILSSTLYIVCYFFILSYYGIIAQWLGIIPLSSGNWWQTLINSNLLFWGIYLVGWIITAAFGLREEYKNWKFTESSHGGTFLAGKPRKENRMEDFSIDSYQPPDQKKELGD